MRKKSKHFQIHCLQHVFYIPLILPLLFLCYFKMSLFFFFNLFYFCFGVTLRNLIFNIAQELGNGILQRIDKVTVSSSL